MFNNEIFNIAGNGHAGYSVCSNPSNSLLNAPCGLALFDTSIYITDTNNNCIRKIEENKISIIIGNPTNDDIKMPRKIKIKNNIGYFIDENGANYLSLSNSQYGMVYESKNIVSIEIDEDKGLFIIEEI